MIDWLLLIALGGALIEGIIYAFRECGRKESEKDCSQDLEH